MKHRDLGADSPMSMRWIDGEGNLIGAYTTVRREDLGLPPKQVKNGPCWHPNEA